MPIKNNSNITISDEIYLENYKEFVKIDNTYYGGNQAWLSQENYISKYQSDRSCGVIAATNTLLHLSKYNNNLKINHSSTNISKGNFLEYAIGIYKYITPRFYGIPTTAVMQRGLNKYANNNNFKIRSEQLINPSNIVETFIYIKKALSNNCPILMITWNTKVENLKNHWVTITGYYRTTTGEHFLITSNWGRKEVFSLDKWLGNKSFYKGLLYFNVFSKN